MEVREIVPFSLFNIMKRQDFLKKLYEHYPQKNITEHEKMMIRFYPPTADLEMETGERWRNRFMSIIAECMDVLTNAIRKEIIKDIDIQYFDDALSVAMVDDNGERHFWCSSTNEDSLAKFISYVYNVNMKELRSKNG